MSQSVPVFVSSDAEQVYSRFTQYLFNAQRSINSAATAANGLSYAAPGAGTIAQQLVGISQKLTQLMSDSGGVVEQLAQRDSDNARNILGYGVSGGTAGLFGLNFGHVKVGWETFSRVGAGRNAFGTSMEIMTRNQLNLNPFNKAMLGNGYRTGEDILLRGSMIEVKAGSSQYAKTVSDLILSGKYDSVKEIRTSKEMYDQILKNLEKDPEKYALWKNRIKDTGISNNTAKAAQQSIFHWDTAKSGMSASERAALAKQAVKSTKISTYVASGIAGGIISGGLEAILDYQDYKTGRISKGQYVNNIARETTSGAVSAVTVTAITTAVAAAGAPALLTIGVGVAAGVAIGTGISWLWKKVFE